MPKRLPRRTRLNDDGALNGPVVVSVLTPEELAERYPSSTPRPQWTTNRRRNRRAGRDRHGNQLPRLKGTNPRALGTNPRARQTNPQALGLTDPTRDDPNFFLS